MVTTEVRFPNPLNGHHSMYVRYRKNRMCITGIYNESRLNTHGIMSRATCIFGTQRQPNQIHILGVRAPRAIR